MAGYRYIAFLLIICFSETVTASEKIVVQLKWVNQFQFAGYYAALEKGFFDILLAVNDEDSYCG